METRRIITRRRRRRRPQPAPALPATRTSRTAELGALLADIDRLLARR